MSGFEDHYRKAGIPESAILELFGLKDDFMGKPGFSNTVKVEWIEGEPRKMRLLEDVEFTDGNGTAWKAYQGNVIDGASIPRFFWRATGSPYVGHFRRASVIHDVYCQSKSRPHKEVHQMFEDAMKCDNVPKWKRAIMARAVKAFGPKW